MQVAEGQAADEVVCLLKFAISFARKTDHDVGPTFAVENITAAVAEECVAPAVAVPLQVGIALQDQVFQVP